MAEFAAQGKTSVGWFYGFKLHLVINDQGELPRVKITAGSVDDRDPVPELARSLSGKLFGDRGYISQIEHSRHRSPVNFFVNLIAGLVAYTFREKKLSLNIRLPQALPAVVA
ncbi:Transposase DDE domain-containing protein [Nitrosomonas sp. Nm34]|nr:Transposase DDE domain-containing protein [Nitrosomonas sp. Nm34]